MIPFFLGFCAGAVSAVIWPPVYRFGAEMVSKFKDKWNG